MAESIVQKGGGGAASDECTAVKTQVLAGCTAVTKDSGDEPAAGTMANRGAVSQALNCGGSYTVPEGYHNGGGKITANSLASQTGGATAEDKYVLNGKTYWKDGVKRTGSMTVASVASFSVAPYSTSQVLATWNNPGRGPYSGVLICAKAGGYPNNAWDGITYQGVGNNSAVNGTSSQIIGGLAAGTTYYFRIWVYCTCSAGDQYSGYLQTTCVPTAHGRVAFTASGSWTVPVGVRSINVHCTGGGGAGALGSSGSLPVEGGLGGGGGRTAYRNNIAVSHGNVVHYIVGAGGPVDTSLVKTVGGNSSATLNGETLVSAYGGNTKSDGTPNFACGGSGGGRSGYFRTPSNYNASTSGASDGADSLSSNNYHKGQGTTTREFGIGTFYGGGGGGGGCGTRYSGNGSYYGLNGSPGGAGGGGAGGGAGGKWAYTGGSSDWFALTDGISGAHGTGGGGGGNSVKSYQESKAGGGGVGNVVITW